jgi:hypothetical protein
MANRSGNRNEKPTESAIIGLSRLALGLSRLNASPGRLPSWLAASRFAVATTWTT